MDYTIHLIGMILLVICHGIYTEKPFRDLYSAGNTKCKAGTECEFKEYSYRWCYVDDDGNWEYCCSDACALRDKLQSWCHTGSRWLHCTEPSYTAENGQTCIPEFPCGLHPYALSKNRYWCYTEEARKTQIACCPPYTPDAAYGCNM